MKYNIGSIVLLLHILMPVALCAGYESTPKEEALSRMDSASYDEAYLTSLKEEVSRSENVDDAYLTENQEMFDRRGIIDEAALTKAAEKASR